MDIQAEKQIIRQHVDKGNYHAGINIAISAMNACRRDKDQAGVDTFIVVVKGIVKTLSDEFSSK